MFSHFDDAVKHYEKGLTYSLFNGIGFQLSREQNITIIDLDDKLHSPATEQELTWMCAISANLHSYAELSVSGRGVHIVCSGNLPLKADGKTGRHWGAIELYDSERYMTFTGVQTCEHARFWPLNVQPLTEVFDCQLHLTNLARWIDAQRPDSGLGGDYPALVEVAPKLSDEQLIAKLQTFKTWGKIFALAKMDCAIVGHSDDSRMDLALVQYLANSSPSNAQVKRIFRTTPLGQRPNRHIGCDRRLDLILGRLRGNDALSQAAHEKRHAEYMANNPLVFSFTATPLNSKRY